VVEVLNPVLLGVVLQEVEGQVEILVLLVLLELLIQVEEVVLEHKILLVLVIQVVKEL
jgi:hypothetical protein